MPGEEAGGTAADGRTGPVVGDGPLSGTVKDRTEENVHCERY